MDSTWCPHGVHYLNRCDQCDKRVEEWDRTRPDPQPMKINWPEPDGSSPDRCAE
jgi:hypothetical protein